MLTVSEDDIQILNLLQKDFPLSQRPFQAIAAQLGNSESEIVKRLQTLQEAGVISCLGAVFNHEKAGASTLVAMAVPDQYIETIAAYVSALPQVNHNYKREHRYNLWFVLTASTQAEIDGVLKALQDWPSFPLLNLPMEKGYHIDLGFPLC